MKFAKSVIAMVKILPANDLNSRLSDQTARSATAIGANYLEANDGLGKKDFHFKLRIARKEAKEALYWLNLILEANIDLEDIIAPLVQEARELKNILSTIIIKSE